MDAAGVTGLQRLAEAGLGFSALVYAGAVLADLAEHFRLERRTSGRWFGWRAVTPGETAVHLAIGSLLFGLFWLARPLPAAPVLRDVFVVAAPLGILALGWLDELGFHRRRVEHREHLMHTTSHLALGSCVVFLLWARVYPWP